MNLRALFVVVAALLPVLLHAEAQPASSPHYFASKPGSLQKAKQRLAAGDTVLSSAFKKLVQDADKALHQTPPSVTQKSKLILSHDPHDFASLSPYYWPDPNQPNGLPYVNLDGKTNPESKDLATSDSLRIALMSRSVEALALAYYFTGKETYAKQAAKFVHTWFLDSKTKMNPNLQFAHARVGTNNGSSGGVLEGRHIAVAADALGLLAGSKSWTTNDRKEMNEWLTTYFNWLMTSHAGRGEHNSKNNHGTWFDVQSAKIALCLGQTDVARRIVKEAMNKRVAAQIEDDGTQPLELKRTAAFHYSWYSIEALTELATLGEYVGVDLWHFSAGKRRSIRGAIDFMVPFVDVPAQKWPYQQINAMKEDDYLSSLRNAALAYGAPEYESIIAKYPSGESMRFQLLFPSP